MLKNIHSIVSAIGLLLPTMAQAQGTLYVSNLGQTSTSSAVIANDSWIAQGFQILTTDPNTYTLNSIQLLMSPSSGNPNHFAVSIYSASNLGGGGPHNNLGSLDGSTDPAAGGLFTYTASGITVSPGTYYVVVTAATTVAQGAYVWNAANGAGNGNWSIADLYYSSANGSSWTGHGRSVVFQLALFATPVPEPATGALFLISLVCLRFWRRKQCHAGARTGNVCVGRTRNIASRLPALAQLFIMKPLSMIFFAVVLAAEVFGPSYVQAQGTIYVSNIAESSSGSNAVANDSWFAASFRTGANFEGYDLNSIQLLTDSASGSPNGFSASLYNSGRTGPLNNLGSFNGADPSAGGVFTYTASGLTLSPSSVYFVVLTAATPLASGAYYWSLANTSNYDSSDAWQLGTANFSSIDGSSWMRAGSFPFQLAVYATPVPEPATFAFCALGTLLLGFHRWRNYS